MKFTDGQVICFGRDVSNNGNEIIVQFYKLIWNEKNQKADKVVSDNPDFISELAAAFIG